MYPAIGTIQAARFTGLPYVRKVNSTDDIHVGNMTYGQPPQIYGHASIVFQFTPPNTINLFPNTAHITTWFGNQMCRIYENGYCRCGANPTWQICNFPDLTQGGVLCAQAARLNTILYLRANRFIVTENNVVGSNLDENLLQKKDILMEDSLMNRYDTLFQSKKIIKKSKK